MSTVIILLGPPGSGKGTQAKRLAEAFKLPHISTGDLFRENISLNTDLGKKAKGFINAGNLVPDELVLDMLFDRVAKADCQNGYILDGFPRTIPQAEAFQKKLGKANVVVYDLDVPNDVIITRTIARLTCKRCGQIYNLQLSKPAKEGICDRCGSELYQRADDRLEVIEERLRVYQRQTAPLLEYYQKQNLLTRFDGNKAPDRVFQELCNSFKSVVNS